MVWLVYELKRDKQRVLAVDDEKSNLKVLSELLQNDANISLAKDGAQALRKAIELQPDLILLDIMMPDMSGFEVIRLLKQDPLTSHIPVIFITALNDVLNEEKGLELGACDYISKPFNSAVCKARVRLHLRLARQQTLLERLAKVDPLTSIGNRRKYDEVFEREFKVSSRAQTPFSLAMIDIDHFKSYNDQYGHVYGDAALKKVAGLIESNLRRPRDFVARFGGEEFVAILPDTSAEQARLAMENCRRAVAEFALEANVDGVDSRLTISIGGTTCIPEPGIQANHLLTEADSMLYQAKKLGRNQIQWRGL